MSSLKRFNGTDWERIGIMPDVAMSPQTLGYAETTTLNLPVTGAAVALPGLSVNIVVPEGRRLRVKGYCYVNSNTANARSAMYIFLDGTDQLQAGFVHHSTAGMNTTLEAEVIVTPSAGMHTIQLSGGPSSGTSTFFGQPDYPAFILVEDITGSTLPYQPASVPVGQLGYAFVTANQASITAQAPIVGLSVNVVVPAGRVLKIRAEAYFQNNAVNAAAGARMFLQQDGVQIQQADHRLTAANIPEKYTIERIISPSAGSHTYQVTADNGGGGSVTMVAGAPYPAFLTVEDITPTPAPSSGAPGSTLGYAEQSADLAISTETALPGKSVTVTVPAGRRLRISTQGQINNDPNAGTFTTRIKEDGVTVGRVSADPLANAETMWYSGDVITTPTAGTHTYTVTGFKNGAGTGTYFGNTSVPASYLLVEDITGSVWPEGSEVTAGMVASEAWTSWTPSFTNFTLGNGAIGYAHYVKIGRTVNYRLRINLGSTSVMGVEPDFTLPVAAAAYVANHPIGHINLRDAGIADYLGTVLLLTTTQGRLKCHGASGTYVTTPAITSTVPFTWGDGDSISVSGTYEAAS